MTISAGGQGLCTGLKEGMEVFEVEEKVAEVMDRENLRLSPAPVYVRDGNKYAFDGILPSNIANFSDNDLTDFYGVMTTWADYVSGKLIWTKLHKKKIEEQLDFFLRRRTKELRGQKEEAQLDVRYVQLRAELLYFTYLTELYAMAEARAKRDLNTISRLFSVRIAGSERAGRATNMQYGSRQVT